jgi:hypothetical protein
LVALRRRFKPISPHAFASDDLDAVLALRLLGAYVGWELSDSLFDGFW